MKFPLTIFSIYLLCILILYAFQQARKVPKKPGQPKHFDESLLSLGLSELLHDTIRVYLLFATVAVLSIALGKPDYLGQFAAWGIVSAQILKALTISRAMMTGTLVLRVLAYLLLGYLWILNLPVFDVVPT